MKINPYDFSGKTIRILTDEDGNPWWVGNDVCRALGMNNPPRIISGLDDYEKSTIRITHGGPERNIINEAGLYHLLAKAKTKRGERFRRWCFGEVLPSIRKTGSYSITKPDLPTTKLGWMELAVENERAKQILLPKADALDKIASKDGLYTLTQVAKLIGIGPRKDLIDLLLDKAVLYRTKERGPLLPKQYYINKGWFDVKLWDDRYPQTLVTNFGLARLGTRFSPLYEKVT